MKYPNLIIALVACFGLACDAAAPSSDAATAEPSSEAPKPSAPEYHYSPFVVHVQGSGDFDIITFKDVGLKREDYTPADPTLETLAQAVSFELSQSSLQLESEVSYDMSMLNPEKHRSCDLQHIYVDIWHSASDAWGYSLWSGCGDDDNFAWHQMEHPIDPEQDLVNQVTPLARALTASIAEASRTRCFQKNC